MDKQTLKSIILELRDEKGMTFSQISNVLREEYGIIKSRQAICGMYERTVATLENNESPEELILITDVLNISSLGYATSVIKDKLSDQTLTTYKINNIISKNSDRLLKIKEKQKEIVGERLKNNYTFKEISNALTYKNIKPKDSMVKALINEVANDITKDLVLETSAKILKLTEDINLAKQISIKRNVSAKTGDIKKAMTMIE